MARPQRNNADYFSHDVNFRNDPKMRAVRNKFGFVGYGVVCMMHEILAYTDGFVVEWDELSQEIFAGDIGLEIGEMQEVITFCVKVQLFSLQNKQLFSLRLTDSLRSLVEKRKNLRQKYTPDPPDDDEGDISETETPPTEPITPISASETPQSKAKQSKAKQSKKEEGEGALSAQEFSEEKLQVLSDEEAQELNRIVAALVKSGVPQRFIIAAYLHYAAKGWVLTEGVVIQPRNRIKTILSAWSTPRKRKAIEWKEPDVKIPPEQKSAQNQHSDNYDEELRAWSNRKSAPTVGLMSGFAPPS